MSLSAEHLTFCPRCDAALRWLGTLVDQPRCACGHLPDRAALERDQRAMADLLGDLLSEPSGGRRAT